MPSSSKLFPGSWHVHFMCIHGGFFQMDAFVSGCKCNLLLSLTESFRHSLKCLFYMFKSFRDMKDIEADSWALILLGDQQRTWNQCFNFLNWYCWVINWWSELVWHGTICLYMSHVYTLMNQNENISSVCSFQ